MTTSRIIKGIPGDMFKRVTVHGSFYGIFLNQKASGATVSNTRVVASKERGIEVQARDTTIGQPVQHGDVVIADSTAYGIFVSSENCVVQNTQVSRSGNSGIYIKSGNTFIGKAEHGLLGRVVSSFNGDRGSTQLIAAGLVYSHDANVKGLVRIENFDTSHNTASGIHVSTAADALDNGSVQIGSLEHRPWGRVFTGGNLKSGVYIDSKSATRISIANVFAGIAPPLPASVHDVVEDGFTSNGEDRLQSGDVNYGNELQGIYLGAARGGAHDHIASSVISGNGRNGIYAALGALTVESCLIGLSVNGEANVSNAEYGIHFNAPASSPNILAVLDSQIGGNGYLGYRADGGRLMLDDASEVYTTGSLRNGWRGDDVCSETNCNCSTTADGKETLACIDADWGSHHRLPAFTSRFQVVKLVDVGMITLPFEEVPGKSFNTLEVLDLSSNPDLDPFPRDSPAGNDGVFNGSDFQSLNALSLRGCDLSRMQNNTFTQLKLTLEALDLSFPAKPPPLSVVVNLTSFSKLGAIIWYDNSLCPPGFYALSEFMSADNVGVCARCKVGTEKQAVGGFGPNACVPCRKGFDDHDADSTTPCIPSTFSAAADWDVHVVPNDGSFPARNETAVVSTNTSTNTSRSNVRSPAGYLNKYTYGAGTTYELDPLPRARSQLLQGWAYPAQDERLTISYTMVFLHRDNRTAAYPGKFFVDANGGAFAKDLVVGKYIGTLEAKDGDGNVAPVRTWSFDVLRPDVDVESYGPLGRPCFNGGIPVDKVILDQRFECDCSQLLFDGDNCEVSTTTTTETTTTTTSATEPVLPFDAASAGSDDRDSKVVGAVLGVVVTLLAIIILAYIYSSRKAKNQAHDFKLQIDRLTESGELSAAQNTLPMEVRRRDVRMLEKLGEGGYVYDF